MKIRRKLFTNTYWLISSFPKAVDEIKIDWKKKRELKQFSQREKVPSDIAKEGRKSGVIQKDKSGKWRIISYKTNPPEFWNAHYDTREDAEKALGAYHANK